MVPDPDLPALIRASLVELCGERVLDPSDAPGPAFGYDGDGVAVAWLTAGDALIQGRPGRLSGGSPRRQRPARGVRCHFPAVRRARYRRRPARSGPGLAAFAVIVEPPGQDVRPTDPQHPILHLRSLDAQAERLECARAATRPARSQRTSDLPPGARADFLGRAAGADRRRAHPARRLGRGLLRHDMTTVHSSVARTRELLGRYVAECPYSGSATPTSASAPSSGGTSRRSSAPLGSDARGAGPRGRIRRGADPRPPAPVYVSGRGGSGSHWLGEMLGDLGPFANAGEVQSRTR